MIFQVRSNIGYLRTFFDSNIGKNTCQHMRPYDTHFLLHYVWSHPMTNLVHETYIRNINNNSKKSLEFNEYLCGPFWLPCTSFGLLCTSCPLHVFVVVLNALPPLFKEYEIITRLGFAYLFCRIFKCQSIFRKRWWSQSKVLHGWQDIFKK